MIQSGVFDREHEAQSFLELIAFTDAPKPITNAVISEEDQVGSVKDSPYSSNSDTYQPKPHPKPFQIIKIKGRDWRIADTYFSKPRSPFLTTDLPTPTLISSLLERTGIGKVSGSTSGVRRLSLMDRFSQIWNSNILAISSPLSKGAIGGGGGGNTSLNDASRPDHEEVELGRFGSTSETPGGGGIGGTGGTLDRIGKVSGTDLHTLHQGGATSSDMNLTLRGNKGTEVSSLISLPQINGGLGGKYLPTVVFSTESGCPLSVFSIIPYVDKSKVKPKRTRAKILFGSQALGGLFSDRINLLGPMQRKGRTESYAHLIKSSKSLVPGSEGLYNPLFLDDPELTTGKHKTVITLPSYIGSIIQYTRPQDIKKELNEHFRETRPTVDPSLTLSQIRNLKDKMLMAAWTVDIELSSVACAYVYLEKLILKNYVTKLNRKLVAAICILLAVKIRMDKRIEYRELLEALEVNLEVSPKDVLQQEFAVFAALEFNLYLPVWEILPHLDRIIHALRMSQPK